MITLSKIVVFGPFSFRSLGLGEGRWIRCFLRRSKQFRSAALPFSPPEKLTQIFKNFYLTFWRCNDNRVTTIRTAWQTANVVRSFVALAATARKLSPSTSAMVTATKITKRRQNRTPPISRFTPPRLHPCHHHANPHHPAKFHRNWPGGCRDTAVDRLSWWMASFCFKISNFWSRSPTSPRKTPSSPGTKQIIFA